MRKIHPKYEDPIDNQLIELSEFLSPYFKQLNMSANDITTLSFIFGLLSICFLYYDCYEYSFIFYFISYFFDVMDGYYARKYRITSKFGDLYDHTKDMVVGLVLFYTIINKVYYKNSKYINIYLFIIIFFFILMNYYLGCQENIYNKNNDNNSVLNFHKKLCKYKPKKQIKIMKYFGTGTYNVILCLLIYYIKIMPQKYDFC